MYKNRIYFDFALPISASVLELPLCEDKQSYCFYQEHLKIVLVLSGAINLCRKGKTVRYEPQEPILLDSEVFFSIKPMEKDTTILSIDIDSNYYKKMFPHIVSTVFREHPEDTGNELVTQILNTAFSVIESKAKNYSFIDNAVVSILKDILDTQQIFCPIIDSNFKNKETQYEYICLMQQVMLYINENHEQKVSLSYLAEKNLLSENYLSHLIKRISGKTFKELLSYVRCIKSEEHLLKSDWKINEISYEVGFSLSDYYKKNFKKLYGITPQECKDIYFSYVKNRVEPVELSVKEEANHIKSFAHRHHINIDSFSGRIFSMDNININNVVAKYVSPLSEKGETRNINSEISELTGQAFINMQKEFRMQTITVDGDSILVGAAENSQLTIAKNIDYLIDSGFDIGIILHKDSPHYIGALVNFLTFYSRRFKNTIKYISLYLEISVDSQKAEAIRKQLAQRLFNELGMSFKVNIQSQDKAKFNCKPFIYDSFVLTPFAMEELFHFDNWPGELAFSLIDSVNKTGNIMSGGNGLLTWNGIKKPWWNAYRLAAKLRGNIISQGADHIVTRENNDIIILTYNLCGLAPSFLKTVSSMEKLYEITLKPNYVREHHFRLEEISGTYKVIRYSIDISSCLFDKWAKLGYPEYLTSEEERIIAETSHPRVDFDKITANGKLEISTVENSFGVSCIVLEMV